MSKLAVVGSRNCTDRKRVFQEIRSFIEELENKKNKIEILASGGARGVDSLAVCFAQENNLEMKEFPYKFDRKIGKKGYLLRNQQIVDFSDFLLALPDKNSRGTWDSVRRAQKKGIEIKTVTV